VKPRSIDQLENIIQFSPGQSPASPTTPLKVVKLCMIAQERRSLPK
jgi:hypothetical protein